MSPDAIYLLAGIAVGWSLPLIAREIRMWQGRRRLRSRIRNRTSTVKICAESGKPIVLDDQSLYERCADSYCVNGVYIDCPVRDVMERPGGRKCPNEPTD